VNTSVQCFDLYSGEYEGFSLKGQSFWVHTKTVYTTTNVCNNIFVLLYCSSKGVLLCALAVKFVLFYIKAIFLQWSAYWIYEKPGITSSWSLWLLFCFQNCKAWNTRFTTPCSRCGPSVIVHARGPSAPAAPKSLQPRYGRYRQSTMTSAHDIMSQVALVSWFCFSDATLIFSRGRTRIYFHMVCTYT
jgi:hypothetical protein